MIEANTILSFSIVDNYIDLDRVPGLIEEPVVVQLAFYDKPTNQETSQRLKQRPWPLHNPMDTIRAKVSHAMKLLVGAVIADEQQVVSLRASKYLSNEQTTTVTMWRA